MKLRVIHDAPEKVISRGFHRLHWPDFDAVVIIRPQAGKSEDELFDLLLDGNFILNQELSK